ncbi:hypothetical protein A3F66_06340 [candidate division TM6 bacterium RIFCSPHIGHO2_12_FULL_32_22]|nr:MAG: hypothetical protein A3F66_06340 [candidate division TM6 bacterium RIFCSPHIGHO2_12_FULL_32_22]
MNNIQFPKFWPVTQNSNFVSQGTTFFALKGKNFNGLDFIEDALKKGADKIITDQEILPELENLISSYNAKLVKVKNGLVELSKSAAKSLNFPAQKLKILGVTGTKGKTTTTFLLHHILKSLGFKAAMISGVKNIINDTEFKSELTTPHADYIQTFLATCVENQIEYIVMEVSAQALTLHRVDEIEFNGIIFTNLSQEHAEFYSSIEKYFEAKEILFSKLKSGAPAVVNIFDEFGIRLHKKYRPFSLGYSNSDFQIKNISSDFGGIKFEIDIRSLLKFASHPSTSSGRAAARGEPVEPYERFLKKKFSINIVSKLIGKFNAINCADAFALSVSLGFDAQKIIKAIENFSGVPGRMESYKLKSGALGVVDYAHTPSSYIEILTTLRSLTSNLIVVFGAGGERDSTKRPVMGKIASEYADKIFITSDNPRSEDANLIADQIISGAKSAEKFKKELDRELAIKAACVASKEGSIVAVLGKGPDEYQIIGKNKFFFSDKDTLKSN